MKNSVITLSMHAKNYRTPSTPTFRLTLFTAAHVEWIACMNVKKSFNKLIPSSPSTNSCSPIITIITCIQSSLTVQLLLEQKRKMRKTQSEGVSVSGPGLLRGLMLSVWLQKSCFMHTRFRTWEFFYSFLFQTTTLTPLQLLVPLEQNLL